MSNEMLVEVDANQTTLFEVEAPITEPTYSPYKCASVVNEQLVEMGVEKVLPPQMFYTYVKKGYIKSETDQSGKKYVKHSELVEWFVKYCTKNNIK
jgi:hypothetical protein